MRRRRPVLWAAIGTAIVVVALVAVVATQVGSDPRADDTASRLLDQEAPDVSLVDLDGRPVELAALRGRAVLVNFWNTWCIPCRQEEPALRAFAERHADDPTVALLAIVREDSEAAVRQRIEQGGDFGWEVLFDPGSKAALAFGTRGQPETYAITPDGFVVGVQFGPSSAATLDALLEQAKRA